MKRNFQFIVTLVAAAMVAASCVKPVDPQPEVLEHVEFCANVVEDETKVDFDYTTIGEKTGLYTRWDGTEEMDVYAKHTNGTYDYAGRIQAVPRSLSADRFSLRFAGDVASRKDPSDTWIMVYTASGARFTSAGVYKQDAELLYDWTKQTIDFADDVQDGNVYGLKSLKHYFPMVWELDVDGNPTSVSKKACIVKFVGSGLEPGSKITSFAIHAKPVGSASQDPADFSKFFDLSRFSYASSNKSTTLSYAFYNAVVGPSGDITIYMAAPVVGNIDKNYEIHLITEKDGIYSTFKTTTGISSAKAFSQSELYNLRRARSAMQGEHNPGTVVGKPEDNVESVVGQWDKTGFLSNDIYGILNLGKPENLTADHNFTINAIYKLYNSTYSGDTDAKIHPLGVAAAGKKGFPEKTSLPMTENGVQYITSDDVTSGADAVDFNNIVLTKETEVYMTYVDSRAWNTNTIGYYCYPSSKRDDYLPLEGHAKVHEMIVFPSTSQNATDPTLIHKFDAKTTAQLLYPETDSEGQFTGTMRKKFPAGTMLGLLGRTNSLDTSRDFALYDISKDHPAHYTNVAWNRVNLNCSNPLTSTEYYWNQIAVARIAEDYVMKDNCLLYMMKDEYEAHGAGGKSRNWTNPIILIYTSEADAIDFSRSSAYWTQTLELNEAAFYTIQSTKFQTYYVRTNGSGSNVVVNNSTTMDAYSKWIITESNVASPTLAKSIVSGNVYYLYNMANGQWLSSDRKPGDNWMTTTATPANALPVRLIRNSDGTYKIKLLYGGKDEYSTGKEAYARGRWTDGNRVFGTYLYDAGQADEDSDWIITL